MPPRLIGASVGRTGTQSVAAAVGQLGLSCYGMKDVITRGDHAAAWSTALSGGPTPDWEILFAGYDATIGWPMCFFVEQLVSDFPDARFLLTLRDAESWFESIERSWKVLARLRMFRFVPRVRGALSVIEPIMHRLGGVPPDRERAIPAYEQHLAHVRAVIPPERLLAYNITDGWQPLCHFLDVSVPAVDFP